MVSRLWRLRWRSVRRRVGDLERRVAALEAGQPRIVAHPAKAPHVAAKRPKRSVAIKCRRLWLPLCHAFGHGGYLDA